MYINPFLAGVLTVISVEAIAFVIFSIVVAIKNKK